MREPEVTDRTMVERKDPLIGQVLDRRYRIDHKIAVGGFGAVYRATRVKSGNEVAVKVLHPQLTTDPGVVARFRREGATLTTLRNPHTVTAYELGETDDGMLYMVMELLRGQSLYDQFRSHGRFEWKRMFKIARAVCDSLAEAHALGIVHRDLKPTNIHLEDRDGDQDFVKVLDFGIAKILRDSDFDSSDLTNAGQMIGTLDYMAPEQMVGGALTGQCDIYTLGIVMYEMVAGSRPFTESANAVAALAAILKQSPAPLSRHAPVPPAVDRIVSRCLERDLMRRYNTVVELAAEIDTVAPSGEDVTRTFSIADSPVIDATVLGLSVVARREQLEERTLLGAPPSPENEERTVLAPARRELEERTVLDDRTVVGNRRADTAEDSGVISPPQGIASRTPQRAAAHVPHIPDPSRGVRGAVPPPASRLAGEGPTVPNVRGMAVDAATVVDASDPVITPTPPPPPGRGSMETGQTEAIVMHPFAPAAAVPAVEEPPPFRTFPGMAAAGQRPSQPAAPAPALPVFPPAPRERASPVSWGPPPMPPGMPPQMPPAMPSAVPSAQAPGYAPFARPTPFGPPGAAMPPARPLTPVPGQPTHVPTRPFDMASHAARDAAMRRMIWIVVLIVGALGGAILAAQI